MKIILKTDIEGLGDLGDIVDVKPGYARNYLLPQKYALKYSQHNLNQIKVKREKHQKKIELQKLSAMDQKAKIEELVISISKQSGKKDTLFGSVKVADITKELAELGVEIDNKKIKLDHPIKSIGDYSIPIKLFKEVVAQLKVKVISKYQKDEELTKKKESTKKTSKSKEIKKEAKQKPDKEDKGAVKAKEEAKEVIKEPKKEKNKVKEDLSVNVKEEKEKEIEEKKDNEEKE